MSKNKNEVAVQDDLNQKALAIAQDAAQKQVQLKELGVETSDLVIPLVHLMQNTSAMVGDGKFKLGDIINTQTEELLGDEKMPLKILPLKLFKTLRMYDMSDNGCKFMHEEPLNQHNALLPREALIEGKPVRRYETLNFFVLLKPEMDKDEAFPALIRFKSTGMHAGRTLATHLFKRVQLRKLPYSQTVELSCKKEKKGTASYAVFTVGKPENATEKEMASAQEWLATLAATAYKIDDREEFPDAEFADSAPKPSVAAGEVIGGAGAY